MCDAIEKLVEQSKLFCIFLESDLNSAVFFYDLDWKFIND
jgi:hypothetical protein